MPRPSKTDQELAAIRDWWTEARTIEAEYAGQVTLVIQTTTRPGVMAMELRFTPIIDRHSNPLGSQVLIFSYPNVEQSTLATFLWRKMISLGRMVEGAADQPRTSNNTRG